MGQSGFEIMDSDEALDVQYKYFERYNAGRTPQEINDWFRLEKADIFDNKTIEDSTHFWLGLALCQWEVKALDPFVHERVKEIVASDIEKEDWEDEYPQRKKVLEKFLAKIGKEKATAKKPVKQRLFLPAFKKGEVITYPIYDLDARDYTDTWGLSVCVAHAAEPEKFAGSLFISSGLEKTGPATMEDLPHVYALCGKGGDAGIGRISMYQGVDIAPIEKIRKIGTVEVTRLFDMDAHSGSLHWTFAYNYQFSKGGKHDTSLKLIDAIGTPQSPYSAWAEKILVLNTIKYDDPRKEDPAVYKETADFLIGLRKENEPVFREDFTRFIASYLFTYSDKVHYMFRSIVGSAGYDINALE